MVSSPSTPLVPRKKRAGGAANWYLKGHWRYITSPCYSNIPCEPEETILQPSCWGHVPPITDANVWHAIGAHFHRCPGEWIGPKVNMEKPVPERWTRCSKEPRWTHRNIPVTKKISMENGLTCISIQMHLSLDHDFPPEIGCNCQERWRVCSIPITWKIPLHLFWHTTCAQSCCACHLTALTSSVRSFHSVQMKSWPPRYEIICFCKQHIAIQE